MPTFCSTLADYDASTARFLELEILESAAIGDTDKVIGVMRACAAMGVRFSLDDFGTGYSSLTYFHRLPIDILKIDQNFVKEMLDRAGDLDIVEGILRMADTLQRPVVAEGVESLEIGMMLLQLGCRYAQGNGIAEPMSAEAVLPWIAAWKRNADWKVLWHDPAMLDGAYDLNVAIFSHRRWLDAVAAYVRGERTEAPPLDAQSCQFGRWYKGVGRSRYGARESYPFIQSKYHRVHALALEIGQLIGEDQRAQARKLLPQLYAERDELIALLCKLAQH